MERQNRALKRSGLAMLTLMVAVVAMGQAGTVRTVEAERFVLKDQAGKMRGEITVQQSGEPSLEFYGKEGERQSSIRGGDLMFFSKGELTRITAEGLTVSTQEGHIDLGGVAGLRLKITSTSDPAAYGFDALGIASSFNHHGVVGPELELFGNKGQGFAYLNTADGPHFHMEPGMLEGRLLPGGVVDINAEQPLIQITDQQGFTAG